MFLQYVMYLITTTNNLIMTQETYAVMYIFTTQSSFKRSISPKHLITSPAVTVDISLL